MQFLNFLFVTACLLGLLTGCTDNDGLDKVVVSGTVRYAGKPIPHGQIRFTPLDDTSGPISGGVIKDGQYVAEGKGGVPLGNHRVEVRAYRPAKSRNPSDQAEGGASEQYIPGKFNGASNLQVTITEESNSAPVDFDLEP